MKIFFIARRAAAIAVAIFAPALMAQNLPAGKGRETFKTICTSCHDAETTTNLRNTRSGWADVIATMKSNGAEGTESQFTEILDYLTANFGKKDDSSAKKGGSATPAHVDNIGKSVATAPLRPVPWEKKRVQIGQAIYRENCVVCHAIDAAGSSKLGPSFYHLFQRDKMPQSNARPERTLIAGKIRVGGKIMPSFAKKLTSSDIDAVLDYMQSK